MFVKIVGIFFGSLLFVAMMALVLIGNGLVLSYLWGWFVVPALNLPGLQVIQAIGIAMIIRYFFYHKKDNFKEQLALFLSHCTDQKKDTPKEKSFGKFMFENFGVPIIRPAIVISLGWIVHSFM